MHNSPPSTQRLSQLPSPAQRPPSTQRLSQLPSLHNGRLLGGRREQVQCVLLKQHTLCTDRPLLEFGKSCRRCAQLPSACSVETSVSSQTCLPLCSLVSVQSALQSVLQFVLQSFLQSFLQSVLQSVLQSARSMSRSRPSVSTSLSLSLSLERTSC